MAIHDEQLKTERQKERAAVVFWINQFANLLDGEKRHTACIIAECLDDMDMDLEDPPCP